MARPEDLARVAEFRNRLVTFSNEVLANLSRYEATPPVAQARIAAEQVWLTQEYGRLSLVLAPYGKAMMTQFGGITSQDVVRDTVARPTHPSYDNMARLAVSHLDEIIGKMQATSSPRTVDDLYRLTSLAYWLGRLLALIGWLIGTNTGRIAAAIGIVVVAVITGIVGGVAQGWYQQVFGH